MRGHGTWQQKAKAGGQGLRGKTGALGDGVRRLVRNEEEGSLRRGRWEPLIVTSGG